MAVGPLLMLASGVPASLRRERSWTPGAYVTDGRRLFRVMSPLSRPWRRGIAVLEDCRTLAIGAYTAEELWHMALRRVEFAAPNVRSVRRRVRARSPRRRATSSSENETGPVTTP